MDLFLTLLAVEIMKDNIKKFTIQIFLFLFLHDYSFHPVWLGITTYTHKPHLPPFGVFPVSASRASSETAGRILLCLTSSPSRRTVCQLGRITQMTLSCPCSALTLVRSIKNGLTSTKTAKAALAL